MSENRELEDQAVAQLEDEGATGGDYTGWDDCALFRARVVSLSRDELLGYIYKDAGDCMEQCVMGLWDKRHEMGTVWDVMQAIATTWGEVNRDFLRARENPNLSIEEAASDLLDVTNQLYYQARVWAIVYGVAFPYLLERELLEIGVAELLSRRYFDKAGLKAERAALVRANQGLAKSIKSLAYKKAKEGRAPGPGSKRGEAATR